MVLWAYFGPLLDLLTTKQVKNLKFTKIKEKTLQVLILYTHTKIHAIWMFRLATTANDGQTEGRKEGRTDKVKRIDWCPT